VKKVVILAPFWLDPNHVGAYRVERFIRWLSEAGTEVVVIRAGRSDRCRPRWWGTEVTIADPLGFHGEPGGGRKFEVKRRRPNRFRRMVAGWMFNPDPTVLWALRAARHPLVERATGGADLVLSSSPPESAHVGAARVARRTGAALAIDLRDGWLDEPLRPVLRRSRLRQWLEGRLERRLLNAARVVFVTSEVWRERLLQRMPEMGDRVSVVTNAYPAAELNLGHGRSAGAQDGVPVLIHAGRFSGSRGSQRVESLLNPLLEGLAANNAAARILLIGQLEDTDREAIRQVSRALGGEPCTIETRPHVARDALLDHLAAADGLLLLCMSEAAIPSKVFEYIPVRRPILVVTPRTSATAQLCSALPQATLLEPTADPIMAAASVQEFLEQCAQDECASAVPAQYGLDSLGSVFLTALEQAVTGGTQGADEPTASRVTE
jgi:hypothetical protein